MITAKNLHHGSIYINDLLSFCNDVEIMMHADDTVLHTHGEKCKEVENVAKWLNDSCLSPSVGKTMYFSNSKLCLTSASSKSILKSG